MVSCDQDAPPSILLNMPVPEEMNPVLASVKKMLLKLANPPVTLRTCHVTPASVVLWALLSPAANPVFSLMKKMEFRNVPEPGIVEELHVAPAFVVLSSLAYEPTA